MTQDDLLVLEAIDTFAEIIQMHVPVLVDLLAAMTLGEERHFGDEILHLVEDRILIESRRARVTGLTEERKSLFRRDLGASQSQIANLVTG